MDELMKNFIDNDLSGSAREALNAAISAIYFADNSDYKTALYEVVVSLMEGLTPEYINDKYVSELAHYLNPDWT
ncbi:hypothetical protein [Paenibacillus donghaensis]|uniref:Uncharacterized protein n=1 Tax=Paenibacillus donghaensis TaxID=414771 RepID=A0A2Z2KJU1_9BACL|nr:hypothetical protein [Paenibacillus donghaensis]ASA22599.1 hypothetical protein B9T62_18505 [Paenibacillus donghaensis]